MAHDNATLLAQLDALLETFEGGGFKNVSTVDEAGVLTIKITKSYRDDGQGGIIPTGAVWESKMDEHDMSVNQVLQLFSRMIPKVKMQRVAL